jgi:hypothetical protein
MFVCLGYQFRYVKSILNNFSLKLPKTEARESVTQFLTAKQDELWHLLCELTKDGFFSLRKAIFFVS